MSFIQIGFRLRVALAALAAFVLVAALVAVGAPQRAHAVASPVLGTYSGAVLGPAGPDHVRHIDVAATVDALVDGNINTYAYMIYGYGEANVAPSGSRDTAAPLVTEAQWDDLPAFAAAAALEGIEVWVYLVPPSESYAGGKSVPVPDRVSTYAPFYWDYELWADEIGQLAATHPNITAIAMDDFAGNTAEWGGEYTFRFTTTNVAAMRAAARAHAPSIEFIPVLYYCQFSNNLATSTYYRSVVDGFVGVYNGSAGCFGTPPPNTTDASLAATYLGIQSSMVKCKSGGCLELSVPPKTVTPTGGYSSVRQTVSVAGSGPYRLNFAANDDWVGAQPHGYHKMQILIDNAVVWEKDVTNYQGWQNYSVDLTAALTGKTTAALTIRLYEATGVANYHVSAWFDELTPTGFTLTNGAFTNDLSGWTPLESNSLFNQKWVPSLGFYPMPYAAKLGSESTPTTAAYTIAVTEDALDMVDAGSADGVLLYNMNLTGAPNGLGDPNTLGQIGTLFGAY